MFAFVIDDYVVVDLACGFGWCGSPTFYSLAGALITHLYTNERLQPSDQALGSLHGSAWCDDHVCVEVDLGTQCAQANVSLRRSMTSVLGPFAMNEDKFTRWLQRGKALGLLWDTEEGVVKIPQDKLVVACDLVEMTLARPFASSTDLLKLVGRLRHVSTCFVSARAFFQRLQIFASSLPRACRHRILYAVLQELKWFRAALRLEVVGNTILVDAFAESGIIDTHVYMDASNTGVRAQPY